VRAITRRALVVVFVTALLAGLVACGVPSARRSPTPTTTSAACTVAATSAQPPVDISQLTGRIAFSNSTDDISVISANGTELTRLTTNPGSEFDPSWSPDGAQIVYRDSRGGVNHNDEIYVMNADGSGQRNLSNHLANDWGPAWSPDGGKIAFNSDRGGDTMSIYVMNPDGSDVQRLTTIEGEYPAWSPDGRRIAFMAQEPGAFGSNPDYNIYVMQADGSGVQRLTTTPGEDGWPAWSPDGRTIAFTSARCDTGQSGDIGPFFTLFVMNPDGSGVKRLMHGFAQFLAWSPDETKLLVAGECGGIGLCVMNADGSGLTQLYGGGEWLFPDWIR
jgi:Tol biopolymer transport system component